MTEKDVAELEHWLAPSNVAGLRFYEAMLLTYKWWDIPANFSGDAMEIGPGPYGGILPLLREANTRVSIDPLNDAFLKYNLLTLGHGIEHITGDFDKHDFRRRRFDLIVSSNSLDHGDLGEHSIEKVFNLLRPNGLFCLRVHMRNKDGLDKIHDHTLQADEIKTQTSRMDAVKIDIRDRDIYKHGTIPTFMGVWRKQ